MSPLFLWLSVAAAGVGPAKTALDAPQLVGELPANIDDADALQRALDQELARAMSQLRLPDQPAPYLVSYEVLDGEVATAAASLGALSTDDHSPYRLLRVETRVGDYTLDNSNFEPTFGERDGVDSRGLPQDDVEVALRREIWLATDEAYKGATEAYSAKLSAREGSHKTPGPDLLPRPGLVTERLPEVAVDPAHARKVAQTLSLAVGEVPGLEDASAIVRHWQGNRITVDSEGTRSWLPTGFSVVRVTAEARTEGGELVRDARWWVARDQAHLPSLDEMQAEVAEMGAWMTALTAAPVEEDYLGPVLFEGPAAAELFRQLVHPEIIGTPPPEQGRDAFGDLGDTPPRARIGRRLLPEGWTVVDDPQLEPAAAGAYTHDFEGVPGQRVEVVQDGVVRALLMSRVPREGYDSGTTGHGRGLGNDRREALPAVVTITPKRARSDRKLRKRALTLARQAGLPYVIVVRRLEPPALANDFEIAFTGDSPLSGLTAPIEAYRLYADGTEEPVRSTRFVGVDRRVLRDIAMAGRTLGPVDVLDAKPGSARYGVGSVGGLPATWTAPPVVITELELRGSRGGESRVVPPPPAD